MSIETNYYVKATATAVAIAQHAVVTLNSGSIEAADAVAEIAFGVTPLPIDASGDGSVQVAGVALVTVNANSVNIALGDMLSPSTTAGVAIKHDGVGTTTYLGQALRASTADGDVIPVLLFPRKTVG